MFLARCRISFCCFRWLFCVIFS